MSKKVMQQPGGYHFNFNRNEEHRMPAACSESKSETTIPDLEPGRGLGLFAMILTFQKNEMMLVGSYTNIAKIEIEAEKAAVKIVKPQFINEIGFI